MPLAPAASSFDRADEIGPVAGGNGIDNVIGNVIGIDTVRRH
jgi:hypothetical protein